MLIFHAFFSSLKEKVVFLLVSFSSLSRTKKSCQAAFFSSFHTYCQHLCSSAFIQFDAIMCQTVVSSEDTSKRLLSPLCLRPVIFSQKESLQLRNVWGFCLIRLRKVLRAKEKTKGEVIQESCFQLQGCSSHSKVKVQTELSFLSKHNVLLH